MNFFFIAILTAKGIDNIAANIVCRKMDPFLSVLLLPLAVILIMVTTGA